MLKSAYVIIPALLVCLGVMCFLLWQEIVQARQSNTPSAEQSKPKSD